MSIVDHNGKSVQSAQPEVIAYQVGDVQLATNATPADKLREGLSGAQQMAAMQLLASAKQHSAQSLVHIPEESLRIQAMAEASKIQDPFRMEPCAQAVFMMLAKHIEKMDKIVQGLTSRIEEFECREKTNSLSVDGL